MSGYHPECPKCGGRMVITSRSTASEPEGGCRVIGWTFECQRCKELLYMMPVPDEMLRDAASEPPRSADGDVIMSEEKALAFVTLDGRVIPIGKGHWVVSSAKF